LPRGGLSRKKDDGAGTGRADIAGGQAQNAERAHVGGAERCGDLGGGVVAAQRHRLHALLELFECQLQRAKAFGLEMLADDLVLALRVVHAHPSARDDAEPEAGRVARWEERLVPWSELVRQFRVDGFYERFPAKGEVERVARIHRDLAKAAGIEVGKKE